MAESDRSPEDEGLLSIGELINDLREEFPDVSISKVRFLESQGLLAPARSDGGYRLFDPSDVGRLRFILRQQRDHFLPLKVIKSKLTLWERGEEIDDDEPVTRTGILDHRSEPLTEAEVIRRSGLTEQQLQALVSHGLLEEPTDGVYAAEALVVASESRRLFAQGLEPRHLRAVKHAAEREADVIAQLSAPLLRIRNPEGREQARNVVESTGESMIALHRALLAAELRDLLE
ncbi:MAG TPA: MerR family transcriptional regulator [Acidimicrobiia bacterium]|nr:MerR family transcriptional regulator [Acidimicrobiia bacterium]